jgi:hypothetical protein
MSKTDSFPHLITKQGITISLPSGEVKTVLKANSEELYNKVVAAIREKRWEDVVDLVNPKEQIKLYSQGRFEVKNGVVHIDGEPVAYDLSENILEFKDNDLPYEPLIEFWKNLKKNPSYRAVQQLFAFLKANKHPITEDGCFLAYKKVRDDFLDFYTGTMDNSPGLTLEIPRNQVNEDPNQTCSFGLHCAAWEYANETYNGGVGKLLMLKVNPADVVAVPIDYNQQKMRVCKYEVLQEVEVELPKTPLYSERKVEKSPDLNLDLFEARDTDVEQLGCGNCCGCSCSDDDDDETEEEEDVLYYCGYCSTCISEEEDIENDGLCDECWEFKYGEEV